MHSETRGERKKDGEDRVIGIMSSLSVRKKDRNVSSFVEGGGGRLEEEKRDREESETTPDTFVSQEQSEEKKKGKKKKTSTKDGVQDVKTKIKKKSGLSSPTQRRRGGRESSKSFSSLSFCRIFPLLPSCLLY